MKTADLLPAALAAALSTFICVHELIPVAARSSVVERIEMPPLVINVGTDDSDEVVDLDALEWSGQETIASFTVSNVTATQVSASGVTPTSWNCNNATAINVFRVNQGDTTTTNGIGPYCSSCALGQTFTLPTQKVFLLASGGTPSVQCSRVLDGAQFGSAGGMQLGAADARYLKLDASNSPLTGALKLADGSAPFPALSFGNEQTMGMFRAGSGRLSFAASSALQFEVTSSRFTVLPQIQAQDGTASLPIYSFGNDTGNNTGFFRAAEDDIGISTNGVKRVDVTTAAVSSTLPMIPTTTNTVDLGDSTHAWRALFLQQQLTPASGTLVVNGNVSNIAQSGGAVNTDNVLATNDDTSGIAARINSASSGAGADNAPLKVGLQGAAPTGETPFVSFRSNVGAGGGAAGTENGAVRFTSGGARFWGGFATIGALDFNDGTVNAHRGVSPAAFPVCDATLAGQIRYKEDTDTIATKSALCLCARIDTALTYQWFSLGAVGGTCT